MKQIYRIRFDLLGPKCETATLLDERHLCNGATVETWLCKDKNKEFVCPRNAWHPTKLDAWKEYESDLTNIIDDNDHEIKKLQKEQDEYRKKLSDVQKKIKNLEK